jgi:hypothetical protein
MLPKRRLSRSFDVPRVDRRMTPTAKAPVNTTPTAVSSPTSGRRRRSAIATAARTPAVSAPRRTGSPASSATAAPGTSVWESDSPV